MTIDEVYNEIIRICKKHHAAKVILHGSRAKGTCRPTSDIDIAVSGVRDVVSLQEEIDDLPTLYTIDILSLDECRNHLLLEDIQEYGREIYTAL